MRILFFCGCLEPGRDGVGDYTRGLARACSQLGHECRLVALNDPFIRRATELENDGAGLHLLRLPPELMWEERTRLATDFVRRFQPDWQSLQLVSYGLHRKGILWDVVPDLQAIMAGRPLHIMFHEVWIGLSPAAPFKHRVVGVVQRLGFRRLGEMLRPEAATTSNQLYREALRRVGITTSVMPLINNIPIVPATGEYPEPLLSAGITPSTRKGWWLGLFFGALDPEWKSEPFFTIARRAAQKAGAKLAFMTIGRTGVHGPGIWQKLERDYPDMTFVNMGERSFGVVSQVMQLCDFGVPTSAMQLIGKSGSTAAMLEHGLPVIVTRREAQSRFKWTEPPVDDPMIFPYDATIEAKMVAGLPLRTPESRTAQIAADFCTLLRKAIPD